MEAFLLQLLVNILIGAALAFISAALYKPKGRADAQPGDQDFKPTAREGTEIKHLFGTGPVQLMVVAVMDKKAEALLR
jgi:hypothetical protein